MKHCINCGASNSETAKFCTECGTALHTLETAIINTDYTYEEKASADSSSTEDKHADDKYTYTYSAETNTHTGYTPVHPGIEQRNIVAAIILSIVTCGIYQLYWMYKMNDEVNILSSEASATSGGLVLLFHILTGGIYGIYWSYKMGERCDRIKCSANGNSAVLYLILTLLGFGIITFCLIQDTINKSV